MSQADTFDPCFLREVEKGRSSEESLGIQCIAIDTVGEAEAEERERDGNGEI
jgi:hypothetical protein